jgi:cytochrome b involved in lipid metabolism
MLSGTANVSVTASDANGVSSVRVSIDGGTIQTFSAPPYTFSLVTTNYANGVHTLSVAATDPNGNTGTASLSVTINNQAPPPPPPPPSGGTTYTAADVALHNTQSNCWLIISGKIYNVTQYIPFHPGGVSRIVQYCGAEATQAFNTQGGNGSHSANAHALLANYYIGDLTTTIGGGGTTTSTGGGTPTSTPPSGGGTYMVTVTSNGTISPASLTIAAGSIVNFQYSNPGDEVILTFSPKPPNDLKLDHDITMRSFTFTQTGTYSYHRTEGGGTNATIVVQ